MININLLPKDLRRRSGPDYWKAGAVATAAVVVVTVGVLEFTVGRTISTLGRNIDELKSEIAVLQPQVQERNALQARKAELEAITSVARTMKASQSSWSSDLAMFVRQLPSATGQVVALNSLTMRAVEAAAQQNAAQSGAYDGKPVTKEVQLNGKAQSSASVVRFLSAFEGSENFGVQFQNMQRGQDDQEYTFSATVGMIGSKPAEPTPAETVPAGTAPAAPATSSENGAAVQASTGGTR